MADIYSAFVQQSRDIAERQREPHTQHHRMADDFQAGVEALQSKSLGHSETLHSCPTVLNPSSFHVAQSMSSGGSARRSSQSFLAEHLHILSLL